MESKMVKLTEIVEAPMSTGFNVRPVFVNPSHVITIRDDSRFSGYLAEGKLDSLKVAPNMQFTRITISGGSGNHDVTVMGSPEMIYEKINTSTKSLLKG
jgi:hypothetical protein